MKRILWRNSDSKSRSSLSESGKTSATAQTPVEPLQRRRLQGNQSEADIFGIRFGMAGQHGRNVVGQPFRPPICGNGGNA
jgi:hypothetical protein